MTELTVEFDEPYFHGLGSSPDVIPPWMIAIDDRPYLLDTSDNYVGEGRYKREGIDVVQQRNTNSNRDLLLLPQDVWRQMMESWHQGAGQGNLDREESLQYRFSRSYGVDPWTRYRLTLLNETTQIQSLAAPDHTFVQVHNSNLVVVSGTGSVWHDTPAHSVAKAFGAGSGNAISVTYDGADVIVLTHLGKVYRLHDSVTATEVVITPPAAPAVPNPITQASFIAYVKDHLILGVGTQLWDITNPTKALLVYTSPVTGFTWKGAAEGNNAIYLIGGVGDKHVVHRVGIKQDGTGLQPAVVAATLPDGEEGTAIGGYLGYIFVGSEIGLRMATPSTADGDLTLGALIPTPKPVYGFEGQDRFVWATGSEINPVPDDGPVLDSGFPQGKVCGLYRMDLSTFTVTESTPAYATDLVAVDQSGKTVRSVTTWNGVRVFSVDGGGVYMETTSKMPAGWVEQGRVSFSVEDLKTGLYVQAKWEPLHGTIGIDIAYDSDAPTRVMKWSIPLSVRSGNISLNGKQFSRMDARYLLFRDTRDATKGPEFTRFEVRARPVKGAASRWTLPILNHEGIDLNGVPQARNVTDEFFTLLALVESGRMFVLQEWGRAYNVTAKDFSWVPQKLNQQGTGWQGVFTLIVEEVR